MNYMQQQFGSGAKFISTLSTKIVLQIEIEP